MKSKVLILAGGKGTRLGKSDIAKPLREIKGKPCIEFLIEQLIEQNLTDITISVCHLPKQFMYLQQKYELDADIHFAVENTPKGTAGIIPYILRTLDDNFLVINGDLFTSFNFKAFYDLHCLCKNDMSLVATGIGMRDTKDCTVIQENNDYLKSVFIKENVEEDCLLNAGIYAIKKEAIADIIKFRGMILDMDKDILMKLFSENRKVKVYETYSDIIDIGTQSRLDYANIVEELYKLDNVVFLDRDGTINVNNRYIVDKNQFKVIEGADEAIRMLLDNHYNLIMVTNQKQVGLNILSVEGFEDINKLTPCYDNFKDIAVCYDTPDSSPMRKPNPGMLLYMAVKHNINLKDSIFFGDTDRDEFCARKANCKFVRIETNKENDLKKKVMQFLLVEESTTLIEKDIQHKKDLEEIIDVCVEKLNKGGVIYTAGNGGSHSDAEHITSELMKSFKMDRSLEKLLDKDEESFLYENDMVDIGIKSICLTSNNSLLTAYSNDKDYDYCLASQILTLCNENDIFIGLSTSGNSNNINIAIAAASHLKMTTILLTSEIALDTFAYATSDYVLESKETETDKIQNDHTKMYHEFCTILEERMYESLKKRVYEEIFK